jgi:hypothetical protein
LGPVTCNLSPICILTPLGSGIGFLPILDIVQSLGIPLQRGGAEIWRSRGEKRKRKTLRVVSASPRLRVEW